MIMRLSFAGTIQKVDLKQAGGKSLAEISLCKKNRSKPGEDEAYTWIRVALWEPADFQVPKLRKGAFIAGSGDFSLRWYVDKDSVKRQSAEVRCTSFDVEVSTTSDTAPASAPAPAKPGPSPKVAPRSVDDEPPF